MCASLDPMPSAATIDSDMPFLYVSVRMTTGWNRMTLSMPFLYFVATAWDAESSS